MSAWGDLLKPVSVTEAKKREKAPERKSGEKYRTSRTTDKCSKYLTEAENAVISIFSQDIDKASNSTAGGAARSAKARVTWITDQLTKLEQETVMSVLVRDMDITEFGSSMVPNVSDKARCWGIGLGMYKGLATRLENLYLTIPRD